MATRLIKDHHNLRRNLKLNDNYISNDGGNEGIRIDNDGKVGIGTDDPDQILHIMVSDASVTQGNARSRLLIERNESAYMEFMLPSNAGAEAYQAGVIFAAAGTARGWFSYGFDNDDIDIGAGAESVLLLQAGSIFMRERASEASEVSGFGQLWVKDSDPTSLNFVNSDGDVIQLTHQGAMFTGGMTLSKSFAIDVVGAADTETLSLDFTRLTPQSGTAVHNDIGIDFNMNADSKGSGSTLTGIDMDLVGGTSSAADNYVVSGIDIAVSGGDTNKGLTITAPDSGTDYHIKLIASDNTSEHAKFSLAETGDLLIETVGDGTTDSLITLDADGDIVLDAAGDTISMRGTAGTGLIFEQSSSNWNIAGSNDSDIIFTAIDNLSANEVMRIDGSESSLLMASGKKIEFGDAGEYISGDGTDLSIVSGRDMRLAPTRAIMLDAGGNITLDAAGGNITLQNNAGTYTPTAASDATTKVYVDTNHYHFIKCGYYSTSTSKIYLPIAASDDTRETTSIIGMSERVTMIVPYDGSVDNIWARSEEVCASSVMGFHKVGDDSELPSATATQTVTVDMDTDDTSYEFDFAAAGTNTFSKGEIITFSFDPTNAANDVHFMIVLKFDVST